MLINPKGTPTSNLKRYSAIEEKEEKFIYPLKSNGSNEEPYEPTPHYNLNKIHFNNIL